MSYKYILINIQDMNTPDNLDGYYLSYIQAVNLIKKYNSPYIYIFRYKSDRDILYLNYPLEDYYSFSKINKIKDDNKEEDVISYSYTEVRMTDKFPSVRLGVLDI